MGQILAGGPKKSVSLSPPIYPTQTVVGANRGLRRDKPESNRLSYGTGVHPCYGSAIDVVTSRRKSASPARVDEAQTPLGRYKR